MHDHFSQQLMGAAYLQCARFVFLLISLPCIAAHGQIKQVAESQPIVRLKATLDARDVSVPFFWPTNPLILIESSNSLELLDPDSQNVKRILAGSPGVPILSPGGQRVLIINPGKSAILWTTKTGEKLYELTGLQGEIDDAKWSPDGNTIMLLKQDSSIRATFLDKEKTIVRVYNAETGRLKFKLEIRSTFGTVTFSPDSQSILTASDKEDAKLWDAHSGQLRATLRPAQRSIHTGSSGRFSPDGRFVVVSSYWRGISLWETSSGRFHLELSQTNFGGDTCSLRSFSPDGKLMVLYREHLKGFGTESSIELRDTATGEIKVVLKGSNMRDSTHQVEWSSGGETLVTAGGNKEYNGKIWGVKTGKLIATFPMVRKYSRIPFDFGYKDFDSLSSHPSLPILTVVNNNFVRLLNAHNGELLQKLDNATHPAKWSADGRLLVTKTKDGKTVQIWELIDSFWPRWKQQVTTP